MYRINNVLGQYHSALEHTSLWIVDADDPHLIEEFALEAGLVPVQPERESERSALV